MPHAANTDANQAAGRRFGADSDAADPRACTSAGERDAVCIGSSRSDFAALLLSGQRQEVRSVPIVDEEGKVVCGEVSSRPCLGCCRLLSGTDPHL